MLAVGLVSSLGVYFGHAWFHQRFLPALEIDPALGDALGGFAIVLVAHIGQRIASLALFRDIELGSLRYVRALQQVNREIRSEMSEMDRRASTDKLTGCWNRHRLDEAARGEMDRLKRYDNALSMLVLDIDFFKPINDRHGHDVGDQVLVQLAERIRASLRTSDSLARWGGEEFIVLCPCTTLTTAVVLADRLRANIGNAEFPVVEHITVSIGVAECLPDEGWESWFKRADAALYRAKEGGRNQVQQAPETPPRIETPDRAASRLVNLNWHSSYDSGHAVIDREHKMLFVIANDLLGAILSKRPVEELHGVADLLIREVTQHFADEESIIAAVGYPALTEHMAMHKALADRAAFLLEQFRHGTLDVGELFQFLAYDLIVRHILHSDRDYFTHIQAAVGHR